VDGRPEPAAVEADYVLQSRLSPRQNHVEEWLGVRHICANYAIDETAYQFNAIRNYELTD